MGDTNIEWADKVWNPVTGCTKISEGCQNCYAEKMHSRLEKIKISGYCDGSRHFSVRLHPERLKEPLKWKKPQRVFIDSMGDWMHDDVPDSYIYKILDIISRCPQHTFLTLTKRPENFEKKLKGVFWPNLWLGVTAENQQAADERIPLLLQIPAAKRFISLEPMLGPVNLQTIIIAQLSARHGNVYLDALNGEQTSYVYAERAIRTDVYGMLDLVILGGETGPKARPMKIEWANSVVNQCKRAGVRVFVKQLNINGKISKDMNEWPDDLRVRELI